MSVDALPVCGWCGKDCDLAVDTQNGGGWITAPNQRRPRALYFSAERDTDYCSAACSLASHEIHRAVATN